MTIQSLETDQIHIPLRRPFVTAIRTATAVEAVRVILQDKDGAVGYGEAPATALITGETVASIEAAIQAHIKPAILNQSAEADIGKRIQTAIVGNTSAKAAVEMAWQDLCAQKANAPLCKLLGDGKNIKNILTNDITISVGTLEDMTSHALEAIAGGFCMLKIKSGADPTHDAQRIIALWRNIDSGGRQVSAPAVLLRIDANQGWSPRQAVQIIRKLEDADIPIDLIEQPVPAWDIEGLAMVSKHVSLPIAADESVFSPRDALKCIQMRAASIINIKLMKTGGLGPALEICELCRTNGLKCMIGCMMEGEIGAAAAAHLAASQPVITRVDLDSPLLIKPGYYAEGPQFSGPVITLSGGPGIGTRPIHV
ncbi:MAG: dipeptide epimerase [Defluviitaleaceae bacterium]|nr:dipeptide epimerase [Defluviitaleaceae bacterium]